MPRQRKAKMTEVPKEFWGDDKEEDTPLTMSRTSGGTGGGATSNTKKNEEELNVKAPMFFNDAHGSGDDFVCFLKSKGMNSLPIIYTMGSYPALDHCSVFEEQAKEFIPQLAMMQTLADYIKTNMPELVVNQAKRSRLTWKDIENNGYTTILFKLHMTAVYECYI